MAEKYPLLLAHSWDGEQDLAGWWISEKLDGVRAYWDGNGLISRLGNYFQAPDWFIAGFPKCHLDGELWGGRGNFNEASGIARTQDKSDRWKKLIYVVFDMPDTTKSIGSVSWEDRMTEARRVIDASAQSRMKWLEQEVARNGSSVNERLKAVEKVGGEGLMMRKPGSLYERKRSKTLLKIKSWQSDEAVVVGYQPGEGKHDGRMGALLCEGRKGEPIKVGTGFSDVERSNPPKRGTLITYAYFEKSDEGVPRFPSYVGVCIDKPAWKARAK